MFGDQYPICREDILELADIEAFVLWLAAGEQHDIDKALSYIDNLLFRAAVRLELDENIANLCEFSKRVGSELLSADLRNKWFGNNCWTIRPRDNVIMSFKQNGSNAVHSVILSPDIRKAATVLHFCVTLNWETKFKAVSQLLSEYINDHKLWSYLDTERAYHLKFK